MDNEQIINNIAILLKKRLDKTQLLKLEKLLSSHVYLSMVLMELDKKIKL